MDNQDPAACRESSEAEADAAGWSSLFALLGDILARCICSFISPHHPLFFSVSHSDSGGWYTGGTVALLVAPLIALASDVWGRRPVLLVVPAINAATQLATQLVFVTADATAAAPVLTLRVLLAINTFAGLSGGLYPYVNLTFSCVADLTRALPAPKRAAVFGGVQSAIFLGLMVGPGLGGLVASVVGLGARDHLLEATFTGLFADPLSRACRAVAAGVWYLRHATAGAARSLLRRDAGVGEAGSMDLVRGNAFFSVPVAISLIPP